MKHRIYIGWDSKEIIASDVCRSSILRHAVSAPEILDLKQQELREANLYWKPSDPLASTEFTYTRFLVPHLMNYTGWALFVDCDFLFTSDIQELFDYCDNRYAVMCVKHDHRPTESVKMEGQKQTIYPRKNWSSLVLWNAGHPLNRQITPEVVNSESGAFLHRFKWLDDSLIGELPETWNWLEGWCQKPQKAFPKAIHFTRGGPWFKDWQHVDYADLWLAEQKKIRLAKGVKN